MIWMGDKLRMAVLCPDCNQPMSMHYRGIANSLNGDTNPEFVSVQCSTEDCINRNFISTIEKKSGMVIYTSAMYHRVGDEWVPVFHEWRTKEELTKK